MKGRKATRAGDEAQESAPEDLHLFRESVRDVTPMRAHNRAQPARAKPRPVPFKRLEDEQAVLDELLCLAAGSPGALAADDIEAEDDSVYLRPGLPREIVRKLRRTHWVVQRELDLHGLTGDEAALETAGFLAEAKRRGLRCVRIIHGKGLRSRGREPVLKRRIRKLLTRRDEVLAFAEPRAAHGGGGAVVVLLEA